jgi:putative acetyltransferase
MNSMTKKTSRPIITIRAQELDDWQDVAAILSSDHVAYYTFQLPYLSRDTIRDRIENAPPELHVLVAIVNDKVVGRLSLHVGTGRRAHTGYIGMGVHGDYQGQGIGTALMEAAIDLAENWLNINRLELTVYPDNAAGIALYKKFRFEIEGTLRQHAFRKGQFVDTFLMARLRENP